MNSNETTKSDLLNANRDAAPTGRPLSENVRAVSRSSKQMVERTLSQSKPLLTGIAALGAAAAVLGLYKMASARPRRRGWIAPPARPSMLGNMMRAALTSAAASLAGYFMERLQRTLDGRLEPARVGRTDGEAARSATQS